MVANVSLDVIDFYPVVPKKKKNARIERMIGQ
jgi:hypothetical protein